jgi:hypothetical protein
MTMSDKDKEKQRRTNDSLQRSEADPALGQDERDFGAGHQKVQRMLSGDDAPNRKVGRDPTVPGREPEPTASRH